MINAIYIIIMIIYGGFIFKKIKRDNINALSIFSLLIMFAYLIVPIIVFLIGDGFQYKYAILGKIYESNDSERIKALISISIFILTTLVFYYITLKKINIDSLENVKYDQKVIYTIVRNYWFILFGIGMFGFIIVIYKSGGISNYLNSAGGSRGIYGDNPIASGSIFEYANILSRALLGCIYPLILMYEMKRKKSKVIGIFLIICLNTMLLSYNAGKLQALIFYIPILIYLMNKYVRKNKMIIYLVIFMIIFLSMSKMDDLFYYLNHGVALSSYRESWNFIDNLVALVNSFTYPYSNLLLSAEMNSIYGLRFGLDYIAPVVNLIPARFLNITGLEIETLYHITSDYYHTNVLGFQLTAGVPNDLLTVAIRQLFFPGIILCGSFMGMFLAFIDVGIRKLAKMGNEYRQLALTNSLVVIVMLFLEPNSVLMAYYHILLSLFLTRSILKQRRNDFVVLKYDIGG